MRKSLYTLCSVLILGMLLTLYAGCSSKPQKDDPILTKAPDFDQVEELYRPYKEGRYADMVSNMLSLQDRSEAYREQIVNMMKQQAQITQEEHQGLTQASVIRVEQSNINPFYCDAYMLMNYGDGTSEQVRLALVYKDGKWWMR